MADQILFMQQRLTLNDADGTPLAGGKVTFYKTGTTTLATIYADSAATVSLANPVEADASGRVVQVFFSGAYEVKAVIRDSTGVLVDVIDPCPRWSSTSSAASGISIIPNTYSAETNVQGQIDDIAGDLDLITTPGRQIMQASTAADQRALLFVPYENVTAYTGDLNSITESGHYRWGTGATNAWSGAALGDSFRHAQIDSNTAFQFGFDNSSSTAPLTFRAKAAGSWGAWGAIYSKAQVDTLVAPYATFTSTEQTITAAGLLTLAHGLSAAPREINCWVTCTSADVGYSPGDRVAVPVSHNTYLTDDRGAGVYVDATNVYVRFGLSTGVFVLLNKGTGARGIADDAKWTFSVRARA